MIATDAFANFDGSPQAAAVGALLAKPVKAFEIVKTMFELSSIEDPAVLLEEAKRWDITRAAVIGSIDNQKHALSHHHCVFGTLDLDPMAVTGLNGLGVQGLVWLGEVAEQVGSKPIPELMRHLFTDDAKRAVCRMAGGLLCWRHLRSTVEAERLAFEASPSAGSNIWKGRPITAQQYWLINKLKEAALAIDGDCVWPLIKTRGEAYQLIKEFVEERYGDLNDDLILVRMVETCIKQINQQNR